MKRALGVTVFNMRRARQPRVRQNPLKAAFMLRRAGTILPWDAESRRGGTSEVRKKITKQYTAALGQDEMGG